MKLSSLTSEGDLLYTLQIDISMDSSIAAIHFVLKVHILALLSVLSVEKFEQKEKRNVVFI